MMRKTRPVVWTIAGSDSGGGAGLQADLKAFTAMGVHGAVAVTCLTAQNPCEVAGVWAPPPRFLRLQLETLWKELPARAIKTGMLYSEPLIREVIAFRRDVSNAKTNGGPRWVIDPVMVATSGARLLKPSAVRRLCDGLLPGATIVTPNLDEAEILVGRKLESIEAMRGAAREMAQRWGCAALVKGGHLKGLREAVDVYFDGATELLLSANRIPRVKTHGTGCTYAALITAGLGLGWDLPKAVRRAKEEITRAIAASAGIGRGHMALSPGG